MLTAEQQPPSPSYAGGTGSKASSGVRTFGTTDPCPDNASCKPDSAVVTFGDVCHACAPREMGAKEGPLATGNKY